MEQTIKYFLFPLMELLSRSFFSFGFRKRDLKTVVDQYFNTVFNRRCFSENSSLYIFTAVSFLEQGVLNNSRIASINLSTRPYMFIY